MVFRDEWSTTQHHEKEYLSTSRGNRFLPKTPATNEEVLSSPNGRRKGQFTHSAPGENPCLEGTYLITFLPDHSPNYGCFLGKVLIVWGLTTWTIWMMHISKHTHPRGKLDDSQTPLTQRLATISNRESLRDQPLMRPHVNERNPTGGDWGCRSLEMMRSLLEAHY